MTSNAASLLNAINASKTLSPVPDADETLVAQETVLVSPEAPAQPGETAAVVTTTAVEVPPADKDVQTARVLEVVEADPVKEAFARLRGDIAQEALPAVNEDADLSAALDRLMASVHERAERIVADAHERADNLVAAARERESAMVSESRMRALAALRSLSEACQLLSGLGDRDAVARQLDKIAQTVVDLDTQVKDNGE
jgi:hypothetical protein